MFVFIVYVAAKMTVIVPVIQISVIVTMTVKDSDTYCDVDIDSGCDNDRVTVIVTVFFVLLFRFLLLFLVVVTRGRKAPESRFRLCFFILFVVFWIFWAVTKPKLGYWAWVQKWKFRCTIVIESCCVRVEMEDIDQERLDIDGLLIRPRRLHYTDTSLLSKRRSISRVHTQNCCAWTYPTR